MFEVTSNGSVGLPRVATGRGTAAPLETQPDDYAAMALKVLFPSSWVAENTKGRAGCDEITPK